MTSDPIVLNQLLKDNPLATELKRRYTMLSKAYSTQGILYNYFIHIKALASDYWNAKQQYEQTNIGLDRSGRTAGEN